MVNLKSPWVIVLVVGGGLITGGGRIASAHALVAQHPQRTLSVQRVAATLSKAEPADAITDVHMISEHAVPGQSFAYASYKANGEAKYAAILASARGVTDMETFWLNKLNVTPLQAVELSDGPYILIAGGVFNHPPMRTVVLTFPNGRAVNVPVSHGRFWYFARTRAPKADKFFKHMIGVSTSGDIIQNPPSHSS
jgi:hypothetical protein